MGVVKKEYGAVLFLVLLICQIILIPIQTVFASSANVVYRGSVTYGSSTVGDFTVNGKQAFCIEHLKASPPTGSANNGGTVYNNKKIAAALYHGWGGTKNMFTSRNQGIVVTSLVLSRLYSGTTNGQNLTGFQTLLNYANAEDVPNTIMSLSDSDLTSTVSGSVQKSQTTKFNADPANQINFTVPSQVTMHNVTTGVTRTGQQVTIKGGESFYFTATLTYGTNVSSGNLKGSLKDFQPIIFAMTNSSLQKLTFGQVNDPTGIVSFIARFSVRTGDLEITKKGTDGKFLAGAEYDVKNSSGTVVEHVVTGSNGKVKTKQLLAGAHTIVETKSPSGYTIDSAPKNVTINAGKTATFTQTNKQVFFQVKIKKEDAETGDAAQGEASLVGAKYGIFSDSRATQLLEEVTIGQDLTAL
ncbi:prealbumin-like fold domain-containing protein, partial [Bacillus velezensis]|uniref:prealbumin-like fold domain-containing protein n=1 Tax=Bacillus velezensis TaxID=492670 RepID=UPI002FFF8F79